MRILYPKLTLRYTLWVVNSVDVGHVRNLEFPWVLCSMLAFRCVEWGTTLCLRNFTPKEALSVQELSSEIGYNLVRKQIPRENQSIAIINTEESLLPPRVTYVSFKSKMSVNIRKKCTKYWSICTCSKSRWVCFWRAHFQFVILPTIRRKTERINLSRTIHKLIRLCPL